MSPSCAPSRPMPRLLHAAERRGRIGDEAAIETDHAELEPLGDPESAREIAR